MCPAGLPYKVCETSLDQIWNNLYFWQEMQLIFIMIISEIYFEIPE
jgi:hypothetical protein